MDTIYFYLMILCWLFFPALLIYWIALVVRHYDFSQHRKRGWFLIIFHGIEAALALGALIIYNQIDCFELCSEHHAKTTQLFTLAGVAIVLLYCVLASITHRSLKRTTKL